MELSKVCLGTMTFGAPTARHDAIGLVHWALDHGVNFFDTADIYEGYNRFLGSPGGLSEEILGEALRGRRERAIITTKVGNPVGGRGYDGEGLGRKHILHQVDASLRRLGTDHVEYYLLHRPDPKTPLEETCTVLAELIVTGKVHYWGFSNFSALQIREMITICDANGWPRPVISQPAYSWLKRDVETDHLPACREFNIAVTPYQPLQGGLLTGKYRRGQPVAGDSRAAENPKWLRIEDDQYDQFEQFEAEAEAAGLRPAQYAIRWLLQRPGVVSVVVGAKRISQLKELIA